MIILRVICRREETNQTEYGDHCSAKNPFHRRKKHLRLKKKEINLPPDKLRFQVVGFSGISYAVVCNNKPL